MSLEHHLKSIKMDTNLKVTRYGCKLTRVIDQPTIWGYDFIHSHFYRWIKNEGNQGIKRAKFMYDWALGYTLSDLPDMPSWVKTSDVEGTKVPTLLIGVFSDLQENPKKALTMLRFSDLFPAQLDDSLCLKSLAPINLPSQAVNTDGEFEVISEMILDAAEYLAMPELRCLSVSEGSIPLFTKGPNGVSILSLHRDVIALDRAGILSDILQLGEDIASTTHGEFKPSMIVDDIVSMFRSSGRISDYEKRNGKQKVSSLRTSKLVFLAEKSAKVRVIAQGDYITQATLKPIHDSLNRILKSIPGDWTFDQDGGKQWVKEKSSCGFCASFDLSNATDRLPAVIQSRIIDCIFPGYLGKGWLRVLTNRDFYYTLPSGAVGKIRYSVGQPMGFYSSFPSFAFLHHCILQTAFKMAHGVYGKDFYAIIGDDVVITDSRAGAMYSKLMFNLGVPINLKKSRLSKHEGMNIAEFAKSYFKNGVDLTPFSLKSILSAQENWALVPNTINGIRGRLGVIHSSKSLKKVIEEYWPNEANNLTRLIEVPTQLGGFGKTGHAPLYEVLQGENKNTFRVYLILRAWDAFNKVYLKYSDEIENAFLDLEDRKEASVAMQPMLKYLRDTDQKLKLGYVTSSRKSFLEWGMSPDVPLSTLVRMVTLIKKDLPVRLREEPTKPSIFWIKASSCKISHLSEKCIDSYESYHFGFLEYCTSTL